MTSLPFGAWILQQHRVDELVGVLADEARADPNFPRNGDPDSVHDYVASVHGDGYLVQGVHEANKEWQREA
jgi:hypothetical protein